MTRISDPKTTQLAREASNEAQSLLYRALFGRVRIEPEWQTSLHDAAAQGVVVHVVRTHGPCDSLLIDHACKQSRLPLIRFVGGSDDALGRALLGAQLDHATNTDQEHVLRGVLQRGDSALLFLRGSPRNSRASVPARLDRAHVDLIRALVQAQRESTRPILLVPQTLVWSKLPAHRGKTVRKLIFGSAQEPGTLRSLMQLATSPADALLRAGPAFDLGAFLRANAELTDESLADKVRYALLRRIERERTVVLGPSIKTPQQLRDAILRSPRLKPHLESAARASKKSVDEIRAQAAADLDQLIAAPSATLLGMMNRGLDRVWNRLYEGLVVDEEGMARIREASRHGTLVLFPSHKSHIDYVVLSDVFYSHGLSTPIVAAGDNLNFWPLGPTLRRAGAFFIHRAIAGQKLYSALLAAYIRRLLVEGFTLEVFLEGGRSRTGKLLTPKLGILSMIVDAALAMPGRPIYFVPISIAYERVIEQGSFVRELAGFDKQAEDIQGLLQTPKVFRARYGQLFLDVGEILSFETLRSNAIRSARPNADGSLSPKARRNLIHAIATQTASEINRVTVVTPSALTATTLLCHRRRGLTKHDIVEQARSLLHAARARGARVAPQLSDAKAPQLANAVSQAVQLFVDAKLVLQQRTGPDHVYRVPASQRIALEYYKNSILHFFAPSALIACVLRAGLGASLNQATLLEDVTALHRRVAAELPLSHDAPSVCAEHLSAMLQDGELLIDDDKVRVAQNARGGHIDLYAWMIRGSIESYRIALRGAHSLRGDKQDLKAWLKHTLDLGERMYLAGEIEVREAVSRDRLENALQSLHEAAIVRLQSEGSVAAGKNMSLERLHAEDLFMKRYLQ